MTDIRSAKFSCSLG